MPSVAQRHVKYETTSLVENTQYPLLIDDEEMGMPIDSALIQFLSETDGDRDGEWHCFSDPATSFLHTYFTL